MYQTLSIQKVASTSWFGNFLSMAGVELSQLPHVLDLIPGLNRLPTYQNVCGRFNQYFHSRLSQECRGELGRRVRGPRHKSSHKVWLSLTSIHFKHLIVYLCDIRHIYQPPPASDLEQLTTLFLKNQGFMLVNHLYKGHIKCNLFVGCHF